MEIAYDRRWHIATIVFLLVSTLIRLFQLSAIELAPDEAYYWDWSRHLSLGYYDQGPMIAYVIKLTTSVFGHTEFGVRIGVLAASLGTIICCQRVASQIFSPMTAFLTVVLISLSPLMEIGSIIATYDPVMVFFWALTIVFLKQALFASTERKQYTGTVRVRVDWYLAGISTGLGFLSKHTMLFILPCIVIFLLLSRPHRRWLFRPHPYLALLFIPLLYSGVIWWNIHHHWWTFGHLLFLAHKSSGTPLRRIGDLLGSQALLIGPGLFLAALYSGIRSFRSPPTPNNGGVSSTPEAYAPVLGTRHSTPDNGRGTLRSSDTARLFLACMGLPVLGLFLLMSLKTKVQGNWPSCAWLSLSILAAATLTSWAGLSKRQIRVKLSLAASIAVMSTLITVLLMSPRLRSGVGIKLSPDADISNTAYGWRELAQHVQKLRVEAGGNGKRKVFLIGNGYQYCALMAFYLPDHPETQDMFLRNRLTMYAAYVDSLKAHLGEDAIFIDDSTANEVDLVRLFDRIEWEPPFEIWRRPLYNQPVRVLHIAVCHNYRYYQGLEWADGG